jgi:hypothetical protein
MSVTTATVQAMMPRHHYLFHTCLHNGSNGGSSAMMPWHHHLSLAHDGDSSSGGGSSTMATGRQ